MNGFKVLFFFYVLDEEIIVFIIRLEIMFGDIVVVVYFIDLRYRYLYGCFVFYFIDGRYFFIICDESVDIEFGIGNIGIFFKISYSFSLLVWCMYF